MLSHLSERHREPELMDQPGLPDEVHRKALAGLARINRFSGSASILWPSIRQLAEERARAGNLSPLRVLDIATGAGDVPIQLAKRAARANLGITFAGCDRSGLAIQHALRNGEGAKTNVDFFSLDVLEAEIPSDFDVLTCSLFLHHLDGAVALEFLRKIGRAARRAVLVNDLIRCRSGYALAWFGTRLLSRSPIVHTDGPLSVQGAFSMVEAMDLARQAGWQKPQISRHWPCRFLLKDIRA